MEEVSDVVTQCFDDDEPSTHSQRVPTAVVQSCREEYLRAVKDATKMHAFLERQSAKLRDALPSASAAAAAATTTLPPHASPPTTLPFSFATDAETEHYEFVAFGDTFKTLGRRGEICTPASAQHVSRVHALLFHVQNDAQQSVLVILDYWSAGGTVVAGTTHASVPRDRRILVVPGDQPVVLQLGATLGGEPFEVTVNAPECLICKAAPRTELFETCSHLVACRACLKQTLAAPDACCPICKRAVSAQATRKAAVQRGEYHTFNVSYDADEMETEMDAKLSDLRTTMQLRD
jgi:hypothetical protein